MAVFSRSTISISTASFSTGVFAITKHDYVYCKVEDTVIKSTTLFSSNEILKRRICNGDFSTINSVIKQFSFFSPLFQTAIQDWDVVLSQVHQTEADLSGGKRK